ncbi:MAG: sulfurtransferase TusA family protein [Alphaproteobacteria bacterium]|nr:sulfurtransferase TusA family protein [Alphaproteobacteria bacterium]
MKNKSNIDCDYFLDITDEICPMTFVKTKLLIERMNPGETAEVLLQGHEPLTNVPRSVTEFGHDVVSMECADGQAAEDGIHRLIVRKN